MHYPVTVLGPGRRVGIWLQGCSIGCPGCISRDTWDSDGGQNYAIEDVVARCHAYAADGLDGITISGGEPFEQPLSLAALLTALRAWRQDEPRNFDILCYSGLPLKRLKSAHGDILELLDAVIPEPFKERRPLGPTWQGSNNQPLIPLSPLGRERYQAYLDGTLPVSKGMQFSVEDGPIWMIGIPARNDMEEISAELAANGLYLEKKSW